MTSSSDVDLIPSSPFKTILNFRDVGQTINSIQASVVLREGRLFRSAMPDDASAEEREQIRSSYQTASIIDLRSKTEHIKQAQKRGASVPSSAAVLQSNETTAASLKIPDIEYREINLNGKSFERALLWRLKWASLAELIRLMVMGYRTEAISILGREVMQPRGLIGLGKDSIDHARDEIREIFEFLADARNYPLLVHCTQGKDRTGLTIMLLLLLVNAPLQAISADYLASERELLPEKESRMLEIGELGLTEDFAGCPPTFVAEIYDYIVNTYGSVPRYLIRIGVSKAMQDKIIENLVER